MYVWIRSFRDFRSNLHEPCLNNNVASLQCKRRSIFREGIIFGARIISVPVWGQLGVSSMALDRLLRQDNFNSLELGFNYQAKVSDVLKFIFIDSCSVMVTCHITSLLYFT